MLLLSCFREIWHKSRVRLLTLRKPVFHLTTLISWVAHPRLRGHAGLRGYMATQATP